MSQQTSQAASKGTLVAHAYAATGGLRPSGDFRQSQGFRWPNATSVGGAQRHIRAVPNKPAISDQELTDFPIPRYNRRLDIPAKLSDIVDTLRELSVTRVKDSHGKELPRTAVLTAKNRSHSVVMRSTAQEEMARLIANGLPENKTIVVAGERILPHYRQDLYDLAVRTSRGRTAKELWFLVRNRSAHVMR